MPSSSGQLNSESSKGISRSKGSFRSRLSKLFRPNSSKNNVTTSTGRYIPSDSNSSTNDSNTQPAEMSTEASASGSESGGAGAGPNWHVNPSKLKISPGIRARMPGGSEYPQRFDPVILSTSDQKLKLGLLPYGLTFHSLLVNKGQQGKEENDLLIGPEKPEEHEWKSKTGRQFRNQTVGRYANRLPAGEWEIEDGVKMNMEPGKNTPTVCLHGGPWGFDTRVWIHQTDRSKSQLFPTSDSKFPPIDPSTGSESVWFLKSLDGDQGFPGGIEVEALVGVFQSAASPSSAGKIRIVFRAKLTSGKATPINLTVHWGWNLNGKQGGDIKQHRFWCDASNTVAIDENALPTGELASVENTWYDFRQGGPTNVDGIRRFSDNWDPETGVDHCMVLNKPVPTLEDRKPQAILISPDGNTSATFTSNQSAVQVYTAKFFDGSGTRKPQHGEPSKGYDKFEAVFLEFQSVIGACVPGKDILKEAAGGDTVLRESQVYENWVEVEVQAK